MRALRDQLRAKLEKNEDYRAWKALDDALRDLDPPKSLPRAVDFSGEGDVVFGFDGRDRG